jgi:peptidyl-prolyl cis-trans isomerase SurA
MRGLLAQLPRWGCLLPAAVAMAVISTGGAFAQGKSAGARQPAAAKTVLPSDSISIVAVVNGDVISAADVDLRRRLFAVSTGQGISPDVLERLTPQIIRQLIDERLRLQEAQRRHIVVSDQQIADAIRDIEQRNNMPAGGLRGRLAAVGIDMRTLIDQIRVQIGWSQVLRQVLGAQAQVSQADIKERQQLLKSEIGKPEFNVSEIFVPITEPSQADDANRFADTVIQQLRAGAPFPVMATQFSQSQTALQGGALGWVQADQLDPEVLRVVEEMPVGAISNPIRVPGGLSIVTVRGKREIGQDEGTVARVQQVFLPFSSRLDPDHPTDQQRQVLEQARRLSAGTTDCAAMEAAGKAANEGKPPETGDVRIDALAPGPMRDLLSTLPVGKASQPLISNDGVSVVMVCSRDQKNLGIPDDKELADRIFNERIELASRQLMRDLQRRALINVRS